MNKHLHFISKTGGMALASLLAACGGSSIDEPIPQLSAASPGALKSCSDLLRTMKYPNTGVTEAVIVPAGTLKIAETDIGEHCRVVGNMFERVSSEDGQRYAIGFEMRLPRDWNGRFFYQANGGNDGNIVTAMGVSSGGGPLRSGLSEGFAVISSDAGHSRSQNPTFGIDPQARLDFGYQAVEKLTPMAKAIIAAAYGKAPDRSYFVGCSNGGRHALVAATRFSDQYDGILAGNPGFNVPKSGVAMLYTAQQLNSVATDPLDHNTAFTLPERSLVAKKILEKCDSLDGATDGIVSNAKLCKVAFDLYRDVPTCESARNGSCLTEPQKNAISNIFRGPLDSAGNALYETFPYDPGLTSSNWGNWRFTFPTTLSAGNMAFVFQTPPAPASTLSNLRNFALNFDMLRDAPKIFAANATYSESSISFTTPPTNDLNPLRLRGGKIMIYHGVSDGTFSPEDTARWYDGVQNASPDAAASFAKLYLVPGMNHCGAGPAADQFDLLTPLVQWVEQGKAPAGLIASVRSNGNPGGANVDVPSAWSSNRTRPLCEYPKTSEYSGVGSIEDARSFICK